MNYLLKILTVAVALVTAMPSFAVTDKEMEQARALAAKHYLRYANNGSDYLDKLSPSSVAELSKSLKAKEQENIKSFNAVAVPKDYASWDKKKLVDYWSNTFFRSPGLKEDGKKCLGILAKNLNKMAVSASSASAAAEPVAEAKPAETKPADAQPVAPSPAAEAPAATPAAEPSATDVAQAEAALDAVEAAVAQAEADSGLTDEQPKKSSNTGWYIGILVVLVGVVIWLVMYASKSMKETGATLADHKAGEKEIREAKRAAKEEQNKMREQYASSLTSKNEEIKQLKSQCDALEGQLDAAHRETDAARRELDAAKREIAALRQRVQNQESRVKSEESRMRPEEPRPQAPVARSQAQAAKPQAAPAPAPKPQASGRPGGLPPIVFLSNVNQKGLFTKASRSLNVDSSVFRMDIPDGHHGKYRVVNDPDILDRLLENPALWLEGGCIIENPEDADIAAEIVTLQPGEALFADNSCRVTKKARIKYI